MKLLCAAMMVPWVLLGDLADGGLLGGLPRFQVPLRQAPLHPAGAIQPRDHRSAGWRAGQIDHDPARRGLLHGGQHPARGARCS